MNNIPTTCRFARCTRTALPFPASVLQLCQGHLNHVFPGSDADRYRELLDLYGWNASHGTCIELLTSCGSTCPAKQHMRCECDSYEGCPRHQVVDGH
jgi:hypothetical protein